MTVFLELTIYPKFRLFNTKNKNNIFNFMIVINTNLWNHFIIINKQMLTDTHCHLFYDDLKNDIKNVLQRAKDLGVERFICVATNLEDAEECLNLANNFDSIWASAGIHPHDAGAAPHGFQEDLKRLLDQEKMIAVGEMGLDYFRNLSDKKKQQKVFRLQIEIAQELKLPIIFHNREADSDLISILSEFPGVLGVAHCFSSTLETAKKLIKMGYYISFSGNLTFKNSHLPMVASELPLENILVETDCPYLSPVPFRGKPNEPGRVRFVAEKLSDIHKMSIEEIARITSDNASRLFGID
jgi:TatD DNase family protein